MRRAIVRTLGSGSSGNALLVTLGDVRLLVDVGLPGWKLLPMLAESGVAPRDLTAVLVTHEHADHVRGLKDLQAAAPGVRALSSRGTARALARGPHGTASGTLMPGTPELIDGVRILPFAVPHDAAGPLGFRVDWGDFSLGIATDLGHPSAEVVEALTGCRMLLVEANHDLEMLRRGPYPAFLKTRIASPRGHLSNDQTARLLAVLAGDHLENVVLAHLSEENNEPRLATETVARGLGGACRVSLTAAARSSPGPEFRIEVGAMPGGTPMAGPPVQPRLFD